MPGSDNGKSCSIMKRRIPTIRPLVLPCVVLAFALVVGCKPGEQPISEQDIGERELMVADREYEDFPPLVIDPPENPIEEDLAAMLIDAHHNPHRVPSEDPRLAGLCDQLQELFTRVSNIEERQAVAYLGARICEDGEQWAALYAGAGIADGGYVLFDDRYTSQALEAIYRESQSEAALDWLLNGPSDGALAAAQLYHAEQVFLDYPLRVLDRLEVLERGRIPTKEQSTKFSSSIIHGMIFEDVTGRLKEIQRSVCEIDPSGYQCRYMQFVLNHQD